MNRTPTAQSATLAAALLVAAVFAVYAPGLHGPFLFDDFPNFIDNPLAALAGLDPESLRNAAFGNDSGPTGRPLAALSFALNYWFAGQRFDVFWFKFTNVAIHALNALLVLALARRLLPALRGDGRFGPSTSSLAMLLALAWALHPIQLTSVLYVVQRMTSLAATCVLAGVLAYLVGRERLAARRRDAPAWMLGGPVLAMALGALFKESALLLPLYLLVIEFTVFDRQHLARGARWLVRGLFSVAVLLPAVTMMALMVLRPALFTAPFGNRPFTLTERLLTESRVLFDYLGMVLLPRPASFGLFHDDVLVSTGWLEPPSTVIAVAALALIVVLALALWRRGARVLPFAVGWFLAGHAMESSIFPLELMHEHRNYLASLGPLLAVLVWVAAVLARSAQRPALVVAIAAVVALAPASLTLARAATWGGLETLVASSVRHHPDSPRAQLQAGNLAFASGDMAGAYQHLRRAAHLTPGGISPLLGMTRIVAGVSGAMSTGNLPETGGPLPAPTDYHAALAFHPVYLAELGSRLEQEIGRRLASGPLAAGDRLALSSLRACIQSGAFDCLALASPSLEWFAVLSERGDLAPSIRAAMAADRARVLDVLGRFAEAREWLVRAWAMAEDDPQVLVLKAALELRMGDVDAAAATAERLAALRGRVGYDSAQMRELAAAVARARADRERAGEDGSGATTQGWGQG